MQEVWGPSEAGAWLREHRGEVMMELSQNSMDISLAWIHDGEDFRICDANLWLAGEVEDDDWFCAVDVFEDAEFAAPGTDPRDYPRPPIADCHGQAIDGRDFVLGKGRAFLVFGPRGKLGRCSRELMPDPMRLMLAESVAETVGRVYWRDLEPLVIEASCFDHDLNGAVNVAGHSYSRGELAKALSLIVDDIDADDFFTVARMAIGKGQVETLRLHRWPWTIWLAALGETVEAEALPVVPA